jgi:hypothetical protein
MLDDVDKNGNPLDPTRNYEDEYQIASERYNQYNCDMWHVFTHREATSEPRREQSLPTVFPSGPFMLANADLASASAALTNQTDMGRKEGHSSKATAGEESSSVTSSVVYEQHTHRKRR